jgi:hypothetical protein
MDENGSTDVVFCIVPLSLKLHCFDLLHVFPSWGIPEMYCLTFSLIIGTG